MKRSICLMMAVVLMATFVVGINFVADVRAQTSTAPFGRAYQHGTFSADSLQSIVTGNVATSAATGFILGGKRVMKTVGAGNDTSTAIPAVNAWLLGFQWGYATIGGTGAASTAIVGVWLQGANVPVPSKGSQWVNIALIDSVNSAPLSTTEVYRSGKNLIRGVAPDTIGRGFAYWRFLFNGAMASIDTVKNVFVPLIFYPSSPPPK